MSRQKGWMFFALGLILALSAGAMVFVVLQQQAVAADVRLRESLPPTPVTIQLPVAARPLESGMTITSADYTMKPFPPELVPLSAISTTVGLDDKMLVRPIGQGETFRSDEFLGGQGTTLSQQVKKGFVLFAFPILDLMSQSDVIKDGDHIDLLITLPNKELHPENAAPDATADDGAKTTVLTLQNIEVFKILRSAKQDDKEQGAPTSLMCSVLPADAVLLKYAKDVGGVIDFTLRSPADTDPFTAPPIDRTQFSQRYLQGPQ